MSQKASSSSATLRDAERTSRMGARRGGGAGRSAVFQSRVMRSNEQRNHFVADGEGGLIGMTPKSTLYHPLELLRNGGPAVLQVPLTGFEQFVARSRAKFDLHLPELCASIMRRNSAMTSSAGCSGGAGMTVSARRSISSVRSAGVSRRAAGSRPRTRPWRWRC